MCSIPGLPSSGSTVPVLITRVHLHPSSVFVEFWCNFAEDRKLAYDQLKKEIQYPKKGFCISDGNHGDLCLVQVCDTWYRARIVSRDAEEYIVFLIDEGKTLRTSVDTLAWGQSDSFYLPPEVEFCVLANALPVSPENKWSAMALEYMKTFTGRRVNATVQDVLVSHRTFLLDISCVSRQMYEMGFSKKTSIEQFKEVLRRSLQANREAEEPVRICSINKKMEKKLNYLYPELQTDTVETVIVTEISSPSRIFCQLKVFSQELKKLTEQITLHYEGRTGSSCAKPENLGCPCAARGNDGRWYRSVLQQVLPAKNVVEVLQVDYGKKQFVQVEHARPLADEFFRMPVVTYVCSLHGIVDRGVGWTASQIEYMKSLLLNRTVIAKFQYQSLSEGVHYVVLYGEENTNINKLFESHLNCCPDSGMTLTGFKAQERPVAQSINIPERLEMKSLDDNSGPKAKHLLFTEHIPSSSSHLVAVAHAVSPGQFWIQTQRYADEFDELMDHLKKLYSDPTSSNYGLIRVPKAGILCAAKAEDGEYYRAAVNEVLGVKADVYFLDYGNTECLDVVDLRQLPIRFQQLPAMAVKCALHGIRPRQKQWDERATAFFTRLIEDKVLELHVKDKRKDTCIVQLVDPSLKGEKNLSKLLCNAEFADPEFQHLDQMLVSAPTPSISSKAVHVPGSSCSFKEYLFPIGSSLDVAVSYVGSPNDFWCQKSCNVARLEVLMQDIQRFYADSEFQAVSEGACVARHPENGMWYRALIIQKYQTPHVDVLLIDFGQTRKVHNENLRKITPDFLKLKGQAFRCSLYNLIHPTSSLTIEWSPEATSQFQEFVETAASKNMPLKCTVFAVMYDSQKVVFNVVDLETPFQSICNLLVQRRLSEQAASKKVPLFPFCLDTYYYSTHGVKIGNEEKVTVTSVNSVSHFFCHLSRNLDVVKNLSSKVNALCNQLEVDKCPQPFGTVCFAKGSNDLWYRGQIKSRHPSTVINFVDFGNTEEVERSCLLPVPIESEQLMSVPVQAVECGLADMPDNVSSDVEKWFSNYTAGQFFTALIVARNPDGKLMLELYNGKTQVNSLVRQFHSESRRKDSSLPGHSRCSTDAKMSSMTTCVADRTHFESKYAQSKYTRQEPSKDTGRDYFQKRNEPQRATIRNGRLPVCQEEDNVVVSNLGKKSHALLKESMLPEKAIKPNEECEVFISHCNSPSSFFIQLATDEDAIYSLVEKLNHDQLKREKANLWEICEGDLVCAMFPDDNSWYRAAVRKKHRETLDVEFVDFGNTAVITGSQMCHLDPSFTSFPRYSIHCSLHKPSNNSVEQETTRSFTKVIEENLEIVTCTFYKTSGTVWEVKLDINGVVLESSSRDEATAAFEHKPQGCEQMSESKLCTRVKSLDFLVGQEFTAYASLINSPQLFWCQCAENRLDEVSNALQVTANALEQCDGSSLQVGSCCIALFSEDNLWYRAEITSVDKDTLSILFVDYGNASKVNVADTRIIPPELSDVPSQAFQCKLEGFDVSEGFWDEKADDVFFELINDKSFTITVQKQGNCGIPQSVVLDCNGVIINDAMRSYWKSSETRLVELVNVPEHVTPDLVAAPIQSCEADAASVDQTLDIETQLSKEAEQTHLTHDPEAEDVVEPHSSTSSGALSGVVVMLDFSEDTGDPGEELAQDLTENSSGPGELDVNSSPTSVSPHTIEMESPISSDGTSSFQLFDTDSLKSLEPSECPSEIIQCDLGRLVRAADMKPVGSLCAIWCRARRKMCRAEILKCSEDSALVCLVDYEGIQVVVDPENILEILSENVPPPSSEVSLPKDDDVTEGKDSAELLMSLKETEAESGSQAGSESDEADDVTEGKDSAELLMSLKEPEAESGTSLSQAGSESDVTVLVNQGDPNEEKTANEQLDHDVEAEPHTDDGMSCSHELTTDTQGFSSDANLSHGEVVLAVSADETRKDFLISTTRDELGPEADPDSPAEEGKDCVVCLDVDFGKNLMEFVEASEEQESATVPECEDLFEEFNTVTEDLIVLTSDGGESDTGSDVTLLGFDPASESEGSELFPEKSEERQPEDSGDVHPTLEVADETDHQDVDVPEVPSSV